ncbi:SDR family oxidoreductase [Pseudorhodobacter aquimaris]|uniref:SDR family oxidoreductase n=1 Tax=Pseudorhodobacter aquimaris TaxID=687412 RepID=UPI00067E0370|nr:SDR family oxidoreductase [Pseudorhodobacter aquimaris]
MQTIMVTGATSGLGRALVEILSKTNRIICVGRNQAALNELATLENVIETVACDLGDPRDCRELMAGRDVDVLVNNAGVLPSRAGFVDLSEDAINAMVDVNFRSVVHLTQAAVRGMQERGHGHVVFVGSSAGRFPHPGATVYGASKAAVSLFADALRIELVDRRIRVTEVVPGRIRSNLYREAIGNDASGELYDEYEPLEPQDVAEAIAYALRAPRHVDVSRIEIMPIGQAVGGGRTVKKTEMK